MVSKFAAEESVNARERRLFKSDAGDGGRLFGSRTPKGCTKGPSHRRLSLIAALAQSEEAGQTQFQVLSDATSKQLASELLLKQVTVVLIAADEGDVWLPSVGICTRRSRIRRDKRTRSYHNSSGPNQTCRTMNN